MELTVYTAFWCPDCRIAKRFLKEHGIPFKEIDIETTPGAAEEVVRQTGKRSIPQFVIDGESYRKRTAPGAKSSPKPTGKATT